MDVPRLRTERLLLTIPGPAVAAAYVQFNRENDVHLAPWNGPMAERAFDEDAVRQDLERQVAAFHDDRRYSFTIFSNNAGVGSTPLGYINFSEVVRGAFQACYMGYALAKRAERQGYMVEAARSALEYMFGVARLHRIMANYQPRNERSAAVLRRLGFTIEGTAKDYLYIGGAWRDHILTSLHNPRS